MDLLIIYFITILIAWFVLFSIAKKNKYKLKYWHEYTNSELILFSFTYSIFWPIIFLLKLCSLIIKLINCLGHLMLPNNLLNWLNKKI